MSDLKRLGEVLTEVGREGDRERDRRAALYEVLEDEVKRRAPNITDYNRRRFQPSPEFLAEMRSVFEAELVKCKRKVGLARANTAEIMGERHPEFTHRDQKTVKRYLDKI